MPTSTAAAPTKLCSIATSSGIDVIATRAARNAPTTQPIPSAAPSTPSAVRLFGATSPPPVADAPGSSSATAVTSTAISMPIVPNALPRRALSCVESPRRLKMKSMLAAR